MTWSTTELLSFDNGVRRKLLVLAEATSARLDAVVLPTALGEQAYAFGPPEARSFYAETHQVGSMLEGLRVHPGEHHALLPGKRAAAAMLVPQLGWRAADPGFQALLSRLPYVTSLGVGEWRWYLSGTRGHAFVRPEWGVQLRPVPGGVHIAMIGRQPQPLETHVVGLEFFRRVVAELAAALPEGTSEHAAEAAPSQFGARALGFLSEPSFEPARPIDPLALSEVFRRLGTMESAELTSGSTTDKRRALCRKLLPLLGDAPIEAVIGPNEWMLMPPRDLVALTRQGLAGRYDGCHFAATWSECREVFAPTKNSAYVRTTRAQWLPFPAVVDAARFAEAFRPLFP